MYTCRCKAHHTQPSSTIQLLGQADAVEFALCHRCTYEARQFLLNRTAYSVDPAEAVFTPSDDEFDDVDAELIDPEDFHYERLKEFVA